MVTTLAGMPNTPGAIDGTGSAARFSSLFSIAADAAGNAYVGDIDTIREISPTGVVTTLAGLTGSSINTFPSLLSIDGIGSAAHFDSLYGIAVDTAGNLYVSEALGDKIDWGSLAPPALTSTTTVTGSLGSDLSSTVVFSGSVGQYSVNGLPAGLIFDSTTGTILGIPTIAGTFSATVSASNAAGANAVPLTLSIGIPSRLTNVSVRTGTSAGDNTLIVGVVIGGSGTGGTMPLLVRGVGPTLSSYGVAGVLADPELEFFRQTVAAPIATNDNWGGDTQISSAGNSVGAFPLVSNASKDAALYLTPASGAYSANVVGAGGTTGIALAEIYDASGLAYSASTPRLINVSARAQVGTGDGVLIAGFVIAGSAPVTVLVRAVGPTLSNYGVGGVLADPQLQLTQTVGSTSVIVASNDNWGGDTQIASASVAVGAFSLAGPTSKDAAILVTLQPGIYSAKVSGVGNTTGIALIEVYEVP